MNLPFRLILLSCILSACATFKTASSAAVPDCPDDDAAEEPLLSFPTNAGAPCIPANPSRGDPSSGCTAFDLCEASVCVQRRDISSICVNDDHCGVLVADNGRTVSSICVNGDDGVRRCRPRAEMGDACGAAFADRVCVRTLGAGTMSYFFSARPERTVFPGVRAGPAPPRASGVVGGAAMACVEGRCAEAARGGLGSVCEEGDPALPGGCAEGLSCEMEKAIGSRFQAPQVRRRRCVKVAPFQQTGQCGPAFLVCAEGQKCRGGKRGPSFQEDNGNDANEFGM